MRVEQPNVTVQNLHFQINQGSTLRGLITTASGTFNNLSILNNYFEGTGTTGSTVLDLMQWNWDLPEELIPDQITLTNNEVEHTGTFFIRKSTPFLECIWKYRNQSIYCLV
ncbi:MAG: hypothetical protein IPI60_10230 [Saprospiraceae bacterium]|nr:hypothetical protein [Saprospiraceae bacterium]